MDDRRDIYQWLAHSDLSSSMLGPPDYPDSPVPSWEAFLEDYQPYYFDGSRPDLGRCFVIQTGGEDVGQINYNEINAKDRSVELDIWLAAGRYTGKGYGTDALAALCDYLHREMGCERFYIAPARKNRRAVRCYEKAGFAETGQIPGWFRPDYEDTILMEKVMLGKKGGIP